MAEPGDRIEITPRGTRGARTMWGSFLPRLFKPLLDMQISRYRKATEPVAPKMFDFPLVLLTTVGAPTGREFTHPLGPLAHAHATRPGVPPNTAAYTHRPRSLT